MIGGLVMINGLLLRGGFTASAVEKNVVPAHALGSA